MTVLANAREYSADLAGLPIFFGKNPDAPNYLTPVSFKRQVLDRYFHNPGKYEVSDGVVRNDPHRVLRIDDDLGKCVAEHVTKGAMIMVTGPIHYTKWIDQNDITRYGCEIIAEQIDFLSKANAKSTE